MTIGCLLFTAAGYADVPDATQELEQKIRAAHAAKDCKAMIGLFYTQDIDLARKKLFTRTVRDYLCTNFPRKITSVAFQKIDQSQQKPPADFNGKRSAYTLTPEGVIVIAYGSAKKTGPKSLSFLYGLYEGHAWLITTRNADVN